MNLQKILILVTKVILLLAVILIFSYVNTKKSHIEKVEKMKKEKLKEGNEPPKKLSENDSLVDDLVNKTFFCLRGVQKVCGRTTVMNHLSKNCVEKLTTHLFSPFFSF